MPLDLPDDERAAILHTADAPAPQYDLMSLLACHTAVAAQRLGVFDALATRAGRPDELADRLGVDPEGLHILLNALVEVGYLQSAGDTYSNAPAARWLTGGGGWDVALPLWVAMVVGQWSDLEASVRTGKPAAGFYAWLDRHPAEREQFHALQEALGAASAAALTDLVEIPSSARRLLDVGGGEATVSIALCARHPSLTATVLDRPSVVAAGAARVAAAGLADRITMRVADLARELDERDHDVLLLCNVIHGFAADRARSLVTECVRALRPGGMLLLLDTTDQPSGGLVPQVNRAYTRFFDLHLWHTQGGRVYPTATLIGWLVDAGCQVRRIDLPPTRMVLVAETSDDRGASHAVESGPRASG